MQSLFGSGRGGTRLAWYYYYCCYCIPAVSTLSVIPRRVARRSFLSSLPSSSSSSPARVASTTTGVSSFNHDFWRKMDKNAESNTSVESTQPWTVCKDCDGQGKILKPPTRKAKLRHKRARQEQGDDAQNRPLGTWEPCASCDSKGIVAVSSDASMQNLPSFERPQIAVIGGGLVRSRKHASLTFSF